MSDGVRDLLTAFALVAVIEGCFYALFPDQMKRAMVVVLGTPDLPLRAIGLAAALAGVLAVWLVRHG